MINQKVITDLIEGKKLAEPIELDLTQALLLEAIRELRGIFGKLTFLAVLAGIAAALAVFRWLFL